MASGSTREVLIVGGGVAGVEALLALRDLAGDRVEVTLSAPAPGVRLQAARRSRSRSTPDAGDAARARAAGREAGGRSPQRGRRIDPGRRERSSTTAPCRLRRRDRLRRAPSRGSSSTTRRPFASPGSRSTSTRCCGGAPRTRRGGSPSSCPPTGSWPLPVYELALMAERRARELGLEARGPIVTPEPSPLIVFGRLASDAVAAMLAVRGIEVRTGARAPRGRGAARSSSARGTSASTRAQSSRCPSSKARRVAGLPADERRLHPDRRARPRAGRRRHLRGRRRHQLPGQARRARHPAGRRRGAQWPRASAERRSSPQPFHPVLRGKLISATSRSTSRPETVADVMDTVVKRLRPPFRLAKFEGDAAFFYAMHDKIDGSLLQDAVESAYFAFRKRLRDIRQATSCECSACRKMQDLDLKFVSPSWRVHQAPRWPAARSSPGAT